jgi:branched-chain amino acid transport system substrate-binding protein
MNWKVGSKAIIGFVAAAWASCAHAQDAKPAVLKLGITTFTSGPASVFGVPAKSAAEL